MQAALLECSCRLNEKETRQLFAYFDSDNSDTVSLEEFVIALRGEMSSARKVSANCFFLIFVIIICI